MIRNWSNVKLNIQKRLHLTLSVFYVLCFILCYYLYRKSPALRDVAGAVVILALDVVPAQLAMHGGRVRAHHFSAWVRHQRLLRATSEITPRMSFRFKLILNLTIYY